MLQRTCRYTPPPAALPIALPQDIPPYAILDTHDILADRLIHRQLFANTVHRRLVPGFKELVHRI